MGSSSRLTVLYGESGVGKSSILQAAIASQLRLIAEENLTNPEIGVPKFVVVIFNDDDWKQKGDLREKLLKKVRKAVAEAMNYKEIELEEYANDLKELQREEAEKQGISLPSEFIQDLQAWADIVRGGYWHGKLVVIFDQFESYFQYYTSEETDHGFTRDFAYAVKSANFPVNFLIAIRSDEFYRLEQRFKNCIPNIVKYCLELPSLSQPSAKEAIKKPIERYNFLQCLINCRLTVLSGEKNAGKTLLLKAGVIPYWSRQENKNTSNISFTPIYFNFNSWNTDENDQLSKVKIQDELSKVKIQIEHSKKQPLIILDNLQDYIDNNNKYFTEYLQLILTELIEQKRPVNFLITVRDDYLDSLKKIFLDKKLKEKLQVQDWYFQLSKNAPDSEVSLDIYSFFCNQKMSLEEIQQKTNIEMAEIKDRERFTQEITDQLIDISSQENRIAAPFLQLVMTQLWKQNEKLHLSSERVKQLAKQRRNHDQKMPSDNEIKDGIEEIIQQYVDDIIEKEEVNVSPNLRIENLNTVSRILYYLSTPSGSKHPLSIRDLVSLDEELVQVVKQLNMPTLKGHETEIKRILDRLVEHRLLRPVKAPSKDDTDKRYEIYFYGLIPAILSWRTEYINQVRKIYLKQNSPTQSLAHFRQGKGELAALLAYEAYESHQKYNYPTHLSEVDAALREILKYPYFSCRFDCYDFNQKPNENDFWQVKFNSDGTMLAASNQDGSLWLWDVQKKDASILKSRIPELLNSQKEAHDWENQLSGLRLDIALAFSQNDQMLISSGRDGIINFWDIPNFKAICPPISEPTSSGFTSIVVFSNNAEKILAAGDHQGKIWLWNISDISETKPPIRLNILKRHLDYPTIVQDWLDSLTSGVLKLFDINNCQKNKPSGSSGSWIWSVDASPDGKILAAGGGDGIVYLWNITAPQNPKLIRSLKRHTEEIFSVAFSPNGELLASGSRDCTVHLWELKQIDNYIQNPLKKVLKGHKDGVRSIAFERNSNKLASASEDQNIRVWDLKNLEEESEVLRGHSYSVCSVAFDPFDPEEPQRLVSCSWDRTIRFWTLGGEPKIFKVSEKDPTKEVLAVTWIDEKSFALVRSDGQLEVRKDDNNTNLDKSITPDFEVSKEAYTVTFFGKGKKQKIAVGSSDGSICVWDIDFDIDFHKQKIPGKNPIKLEGHKGYKMTSLAFSSDGKWLASVSEDEYERSKEDSKYYRIVKLWDLNSSQPEPPNPKILICEFKAPITSLAFYTLDKNAEEDENHKYLVMVDSNGYITFSKCNINQYSRQHPTILKHNKKNKHKQLYGDQTPVYLALSDTLRDNQSRLVSVSANNNSETNPCIILWSLNHPNSDNKEEIPELYRNLDNYNFSPTSVAFSNDSKWLAVGYYDGSIQMWNLEKLGAMGNSENKKTKIKPSSILQGHKEKVIMLAFSPNGKKLLSASYDNTVRLWTVETEDLANELKKKLYRKLTNDERQEFLGVSS